MLKIRAFKSMLKNLIPFDSAGESNDMKFESVNNGDYEIQYLCAARDDISSRLFEISQDFFSESLVSNLD